MYLYINSSAGDTATCAVFSDAINTKNILYIETVQGKDKLLNSIETFLKKNAITIQEITGVVCVVGYGNFSSVRTGVAIANTLAWFLSISLFGVMDFELPENKKDLWNFLRLKIKKGKTEKLLIPQYGKEPNITKKESRSKN